MPSLNQKGVVHILIVLILLAGIVSGVYLVQHTQIFKPKAYDAPSVDSKLTFQDLRTKFKIPDDISDSDAETIVKDDLLKVNVKVEGSIIDGNAEVGLVGECFKEQSTNYLFSEYEVFPPICLSSEERAKTVEYALYGVEFIVDTAIAPFSMVREVTQEAIQWQDQADTVNALLKSSGLADRISTTSISKPDSGFNGYAVTLLRIKELEEDVKDNPDGSGNLIPEQEEARREYLKNLRELWEKQHNATFKLAEATAYAVTFAPLKIVGKVVAPITVPLVRKIDEVTEGPRSSVYNFLKGIWERLTGKKADEIIQGGDDVVGIIEQKSDDLLNARRVDVYRGGIPNIIAEAEQGLINEERIASLLVELEENGVVVIISKRFTSVGFNEEGRLEVWLRPDEQAWGKLHELVHVQQYLEAYSQGIPLQHLRDFPLENRALIEIQASRIESNFLDTLPSSSKVEYTKLGKQVYLQLWTDELKKLGFQVPDQITNPLSPQIRDSLQPLN